ncbi:multidrug resistance efflux protein, SMR family [Rhodobacteraceae bacterium HTCC2150]|nr:multidrug resistance efflux protein, SMR family [Rhodobacteraceae bacterium HTCC2150]
MMHYIYLFLAVIFETIGTSAIQSSQQFTKIGPSVLVAVCFAAAFFFLSLTLKFMPVGIMYAIWSGTGIVLISIIGYFYFKQSLDFPAILGMGLILIGILIIHLFSNTATH